MSDVMLIGVLRMPYEMAMGSTLSQMQYHSRGLEAAERILADEARIEQLERELAEARQYGTRLAETIAAKHYPEVTTWEALPDVVGVLTQIDNMVAGMRDQLTAEKALADRLASGALDLDVGLGSRQIRDALAAYRKARGL